MVKIGDVVFVQTKGICEVLDIAKNAFEGCDKSKEYYVLKPVSTNNNMMVYFPTDTKVSIRKLSSKAKAQSILQNFATLDDVDAATEEEKLKLYTSISQKGELEDWSKLLKTLLIKKSKSNKKQFNYQEQKYINTMLACVVGELSYVLSKDQADVKKSLFESLGVAEEK